MRNKNAWHFFGFRNCFDFYSEFILSYFLFSCGFVFRSIAGYVTKNKVADKRKRRLKKPEMKQKGFFIKIKTVSYNCSILRFI